MTPVEQPVRPERTRGEGMVGLALIGGYTAGVLALVVGVLAALSRDALSAGICFLAAGAAFGLAANALLRK